MCSVVLGIARASRHLLYFVSSRWRFHCLRLLDCCFMEASETHPSLGMLTCVPCARQWHEYRLRDLCSWSLLCVYRLSTYCCATSHYHAVSFFCFFFVFFFLFFLIMRARHFSVVLLCMCLFSLSSCARSLFSSCSIPHL